ncbi:MAG TPA: hypothetical protein VHB50_02845, partial [Bryobacteraceae bacterium]|nr:hypothetical protein [Bryobacteraceae bacterium]
MWRSILTGFLVTGAVVAQSHELGYDNTPSYPGSKWRVHDVKRPHPPVVTPGSCNSPSLRPPSDAEILFDGKDASKWETP